jgi:hypothetical protein
MKLLKVALEQQNYDLAARVLVYGLLKATVNEIEKRGAPKGNQNARKHGFYSQVLNESEQLQLEQARGIEGIDEEIAILRVKLRTLIDKQPDRFNLHLEAANTIARLVRTRYSITREQKKSLKEAITKVLTDIAVPLGIKALIK